MAKARVKESEQKKTPGNSTLSTIIVMLVVCIIVIFVVKSIFTLEPKEKLLPGEKVNVELYVMSQCPYGTQAGNAFYPVLKTIGESVEFHLDYIAEEESPGQFQSLHGEPEVIGNIVQLCAKEYYQEDYKYMDLIICQNKDASNVDTNWKDCAVGLGMDIDKLETCLLGEEGETLFKESISRAKMASADASPTIFIQGEKFDGERTPYDFQKAICAYLDNEACKNIPVCFSDTDCTEKKGKVGVCTQIGESETECNYYEPLVFEYIVLNSEKCSQECDPSIIVQNTQILFPGSRPRLVDVDSAEGKELVKTHNLVVLPSFIFDSTVAKTYTFRKRADIRNSFEKSADKYKLSDEKSRSTYIIS